MALDLIQQSFNAGVWSPLLDGRSDLEKYYSACRLMENMIPTRYGPAERRPGTYYVGELKDNSKKAKLVSFQYSTEQAYILEYGDQYIRFYKDRGQIQSGVGTEDLSGIDHIVAHWKLNDDLATTVVIDADGATHNAVATANTNELHVTGKVGTGAFNFKGTYAVEINDDSDFDFGDGSTDSPFSIGAWIYISDYESGARILSKFDTDSKRQWILNLSSDGKAALRLSDQSVVTASGFEAGSPLRVTDDALTLGWHFIGVTYDGTGGASAANGIIFYVDGVVVDSTATNQAAYVAMEDDLTAKVVIGASYAAGALAYFWPDKIDNVFITSDVLTSTEWAALYSMGTYEISSSYLEADLPTIQTVQSADVLYNTHSTYTPQKLLRYAHDYWELEDIAFDEPPFLDENDTDTTIKVKTYAIASATSATDIFTISGSGDLSAIFPVGKGFSVNGSTSNDGEWIVEAVSYSDPVTSITVTGEIGDETADGTIIPKLGSGTIELTASSAIFTSDHVDSSWLIKQPRQNNSITKQLTSDDSAFAATGISDILVDVKGSFRLKDVGTWTGTLVFERSYDKQLTLVLDASPAAAAFVAGATLTGRTSGATCVVVTVIDSTHYTIEKLSGSFTDGEIIDDGTNSRNCAATYPRYEGWHTLETLESEQATNYNVSGEETVGNAYLRVRRTVDSGANDPVITISVERYYHYGIVTISSITTSTEVRATITNPLGPIINTDISKSKVTKLWSEGAWSAERGFPVASAFYEGRLWFAGTSYRPLDFWGSRVQDYENMTIGTLDDDAVKFTIDSGPQNKIRWLVNQEVLLIGTAGGEWKLGSVDPSDAIAPDNPIKPRLQTTFGSKEIQALLLANVILFVDTQGKDVRGAQFVFEKGEAGAYDAPSYTLLAEHITESGIVGMAYQQNPHPILWAWLDNGKMIGMVFEPGQKVWGWFPLVIDGLVESAAVIRGVTEDEVWIIVKRTINGSTKRYIEYFKPRDWGSDDKDCFFVDSGLTFDGGDAVTITGITKADPVVVTAAAHGFSDGDQVRIKYVGGMSEVRNRVFTVSNPATDTFELRDNLDTVDINSSAFTTFVASISGDTTYGSKDITNVSAADIAALALGAPITGTGIPDDTTITAIDDDRFTMSAKATVTDTEVTITIAGTVEQVDNTFSGLDHLEAKTVSVLGDGTVHDDVVVSSGIVTLTDYFNKVHVGLPYISKLMPMKLELQTQGGSVRAKIKRISSIVFSFYKSLGCTFGTDEGTETILFRKTTDVMGKAVPLFTGEKKQSFPGGYELSGDIYVEQKQPLPLTVRSITPRLQIYD